MKKISYMRILHELQNRIHKLTYLTQKSKDTLLNSQMFFRDGRLFELQDFQEWLLNESKTHK